MKSEKLWEKDIVVNSDGTKRPIKELTGVELDDLYLLNCKRVSRNYKAIDKFLGIIEMCEREYQRRNSSIPSLPEEYKNNLPDLSNKSRFLQTKINLNFLDRKQLLEIKQQLSERLNLLEQSEELIDF